MVLQWFGRAKQTSIDDVLAHKNYGKAVEMIKVELQKRRKDHRLRIQLGDVLVLAGRPKEAVELFTSLADDLALGGLAAKAIAVLKKVQRIEPDNVDVEEKLAYLINQLSKPAPDPWAKKKKHPTEQLEIGMEAFTPPAEDEEAALHEAADAEAAEADTAPVVPPIESYGHQTDESFYIDDAIRNELVALIEDALTPASGITETPPSDVVDTPLFRDFSRDELVAVIRGLRLLTFEAGEILVTEGEPGESLFVLTTGWVRAYVRHSSGRSAQLRELKEGDFFGEISLLRGGARTATITAATRCELLELDKPTLDSIVKAHPHVLNVLQEFYDQRAGTTLETMVRGETPPA